MLHDSQEETADTVRRLREAQWVRSIRDTQITQLEGEVLKLHAELENSKKSVKEAERLSAKAEARVKTLEISARLAARASVREARRDERATAETERTTESTAQEIAALEAELAEAGAVAVAAQERGDKWYKQRATQSTPYAHPLQR